MSVSKNSLRSSAKALRKTLRNAHPNAAHDIARYFPLKLLDRFGPVVAGYIAIGSELNPAPLLRTLGEHGAEISYPRVDNDQEMSFRRVASDADFETGPFGLTQPKASCDIVQPTLVLTPLLAFDAAGNRLGYGKGFYDKALANIRESGRVFVCGLAYAEQEVVHIPTEATDISLDWLVTPERSIPLLFSKFS